MILIVGSRLPSTATFASRKKLGRSELFVGQNVTEGVYHTSLADCPNLVEYLSLFQTIYWADSLPSEFKNFKEYFDTLFLLKKIPNVIELNQDPLNLKQFLTIDTKPNNIIFLGCSHTEGGFSENKSEDYANIVSSYFNLELLNLAKGGCGNFRSFDQFSKIKFYENQIVVLQLTDFARLKYYDSDLPNSKIQETQLYQIKSKSYIEVFNDKQLIYNTLSYLDLIIKYSRSLNLRLVFFYLGNVPNFDNSPENDNYKKIVEFYLTDYKEYIPNILEKNIDRAPKDNLHWGPKSNAVWAKEIISKIKELYS